MVSYRETGAVHYRAALHTACRRVRRIKITLLIVMALIICRVPHTDYPARYCTLCSSLCHLLSPLPMWVPWGEPSPWVSSSRSGAGPQCSVLPSSVDLLQLLYEDTYCTGAGIWLIRVKKNTIKYCLQIHKRISRRSVHTAVSFPIVRKDVFF